MHIFRLFLQKCPCFCSPGKNVQLCIKLRGLTLPLLTFKMNTRKIYSAWSAEPGSDLKWWENMKLVPVLMPKACFISQIKTRFRDLWVISKKHTILATLNSLCAVFVQSSIERLRPFPDPYRPVYQLLPYRHENNLYSHLNVFSAVINAGQDYVFNSFFFVCILSIGETRQTGCCQAIYIFYSSI